MQSTYYVHLCFLTHTLRFAVTCYPLHMGCTGSMLSAYVAGEYGCGSHMHIVVMLQMQNLYIHVSQEFWGKEQLK